MNRLFSLQQCVVCGVLFLGIHFLPGVALAQIDKSSPILGTFDTEIIAMQLTGSATLPLGINGQELDVNIQVTRATDHNSSRSNKTSHTPISVGGGGGDINDFYGKTFDLFSTLDLKFDITIEDVDPQFDFAPSLGTNLFQGELESNALLTAPSVSFTFSSQQPDYGMLEGRGLEHRGHVTVLKAAASGGGGGGGRVSLLANGISLAFDQDGSSFESQNGVVTHTADVTMDLSASFENELFTIAGLTGTLTEVGQFSIASVPEPASWMLLCGGWLAACSMRRR